MADKIDVFDQLFVYLEERTLCGCFGRFQYPRSVVIDGPQEVLYGLLDRETHVEHFHLLHGEFLLLLLLALCTQINLFGPIVHGNDFLFAASFAKKGTERNTGMFFHGLKPLVSSLKLFFRSVFVVGSQSLFAFSGGQKFLHVFHGFELIRDNIGGGICHVQQVIVVHLQKRYLALSNTEHFVHVSPVNFRVLQNVVHGLYQISFVLADERIGNILDNLVVASDGISFEYTVEIVGRNLVAVLFHQFF